MRLFALVMAAMTCIGGLARATEYRFEVTAAGQLHGFDGYYREMELDGALHETDFIFEENGYARWYAFRMSWQEDWYVLPEATYLVPLTSIAVGSTWDSWWNASVTATVVDSLLVTVPAGTFGAYEIQLRSPPDSLVGVAWYARGVGMVKFTSEGWESSELGDYNVAPSGSTSFFPMTIGDRWLLATSPTAIMPASWGHIKSLCR